MSNININIPIIDFKNLIFHHSDFYITEDNIYYFEGLTKYRGTTNVEIPYSFKGNKVDFLKFACSKFLNYDIQKIDDNNNLKLVIFFYAEKCFREVLFFLTKQD